MTESCPHHHTHEHSPKKAALNRTAGMVLLLFAVIGASYLFPFLQAFRQSFLMYLRGIWWAVLLGLFLGGMIDYFIPQEYVSKLLSGPRKRSILFAVLTGFLSSACSHGILALSIQLHKKGASNAAVVAFLLASPWANLPLTIILIGFFGWKALFLIFSAVLIALITGYIFLALSRRGWIETNPHYVEPEKGFSVRRDVRQKLSGFRFTSDWLARAAMGIWKGSLALADMVLWWILIGMILASLAAAYVPGQFFVNYMGPSFLGLVVTLAFAAILEVCSEGTAPLAFEIFRQTGAFGNVLVFLLAGVATDYTEIGLLWTNVGKRTALWLPIITVPQILVLGLLANKLL